MNGAKIIGGLLLVLALIASGVWLSCRNYNECRAHGFSRLYCAGDRR